MRSSLKDPIRIGATTRLAESRAALAGDTYLPDLEGFYRGWLGREVPA